MDHFAFYGHLTRQYPGSVVFTSSYLTPLPLDRKSVLADVGCGFGHRATWVSRSRCCEIHVFDREPEYLEQTHIRAEEGGAQQLVQLHLTEDYLNLNLEPHSVDLLMTEGVGFLMDPLTAVDQWREYVKPGGHIAMTVPGVINRHPPQELVAPLIQKIGRELKTLEEYHATLAQLDVRLVHQLPLSNHSWDEHYQSIGRLVQGLLKSGEAHESDEVIQKAQAEVDWYHKYGRGRLFLQAFVLAIP